MKQTVLHTLAVLAGLGIVASASADTSQLKLPPASARFGSFEQADDPSFRRHVVPLFSRAGCSGRECHGSFQGQGGFRLSLFGYDFEKDHKAITQDSDGGEAEVRINREKPAESLILTKPTVQVKHKGKERFKKGSWEYKLVLKWIQNGARLDVAETGEFDRLEVLPSEIVFKKTGESVPLRVLAHWKDGTVEDVTELTRFRSNDDSVANVSEKGVVQSVGPGDTHAVAFYDNGVLPIPVMLPVSDKVGPSYPRFATRTKVDELVVAKLRKVGIVPSEVCTDAEFVRRASLDVTGTLPTPEEVRSFLADQAADKRARKIDELLNRPAYAAWWSTLMCDWTGNNSGQLRGGGQKGYGTEFSRQWYDWTYERVVKNEPYDQLVAGIVLATGRSQPGQTYEDFAKEMSSYFRKDHPADFAERPNMPYFWQRQNVRKPQEKALAFAHSFLGVRIECAECHKHPFDQWTQTDFKQFQAFFEPLNYGSRNDKNERINFRTVTAELREAVGDLDKKDQKKALEREFDKRVAAGELAPWQEVYVQPPAAKDREKLVAKKKKQDPNYSGRVLTPKILGGEEVLLNEYPDPRKPLMDWMRNPENPYFARAFVNRLWANYFGRGIVEPADDMNLANPPVNKELMDYLASGFAGHGYDMKWLHREILKSDTYQRSWKPNETNRLDEKNFSHMVLRRVPAEVAMDAIAQATAGSSELSRFAGDIDKRAIGPNTGAYSRKGMSNYALSTFGKPARLTNCDCERTTDPTLLQTLYTRNDPELLGALESGGKGGAWIDELRRLYGRTRTDVARTEAELKKIRELKARTQEQLASLSTAGNDATAKKLEGRARQGRKQLAELEKREQKLAASLPKPGEVKEFNPDETISEVFLRTVSRLPTDEEVRKAKEDIAATKDPIDGVRDLLWAMLNTREFLVNH